MTPQKSEKCRNAINVEQNYTVAGIFQNAASNRHHARLHVYDKGVAHIQSRARCLEDEPHGKLDKTRVDACGRNLSKGQRSHLCEIAAGSISGDGSENCAWLNAL